MQYHEKVLSVSPQAGRDNRVFVGIISNYDLRINTPGMGLNSTDDGREGIDKYLKRNPTSSFVAEDDGKIIGVIISGHDGR